VIDIQLPGLNQPFGPTFRVKAQSSVTIVPGPYWWRLDLWDDPNESGPYDSWVFEQQFTSGPVEIDDRYRRDPNIPWLIQPPVQQIADGKAATVRLYVEQPRNLVVDATTQHVTMDYRTPAPFLAAAQPQVTGGFTAEDRVALMNVQTASFRDFGGGIIAPISNLITVPPMSALQRFQIEPDREGEGILQPAMPLPSFVPHAIECEIVSNAAGIGVDEGAPDALELTWVELAANWQLQDGHFTITDRFDSRAGRVMWQPQPWPPTTIDYYITPGVVGRFWWIGLRLF
jgi:hypothetical protein